MTTTVNEKSSSYLTVAFFDKNGVAAAPSSVTYRIDCLSTGTVILTDTSLTPATSIEISITPAQNAILADGNATETKRVTVKASYGVSDALNAEYDYYVTNLSPGLS